MDSSELTPPADLLSRYSRFGAPTRVVALPRGETATNQHFKIETPAGTFVLKTLPHPEALFQSGGVARVRSVSRVVADLGARGLPVERLELTNDGQPIAISDGIVYRMYRWVDGTRFAGHATQISSVASAQRRIHQEGEGLLAPSTRDALAAYGAAWALPSTRHRVDEVFAALGTAGFDAEVERYVDEGLREVHELSFDAHALVHLDLHPDNVLFTEKGDAIILDWDNARLDDPILCVALSVARFTAALYPISAGSLAGVARAWSAEYGAINWRRLALAISYVEVEKILRIVLRAQETRAYENLVPRIASRHLPTLVAALEWLHAPDLGNG